MVGQSRQTGASSLADSSSTFRYSLLELCVDPASDPQVIERLADKLEAGRRVPAAALRVRFAICIKKNVFSGRIRKYTAQPHNTEASCRYHLPNPKIPVTQSTTFFPNCGTEIILL